MVSNALPTASIRAAFWMSVPHSIRVTPYGASSMPTPYGGMQSGERSPELSNRLPEQIAEVLATIHGIYWEPVRKPG